jgi:hypothetical protein
MVLPGMSLSGSWCKRVIFLISSQMFVTPCDLCIDGVAGHEPIRELV